jgi:hypothetical protein
MAVSMGSGHEVKNPSLKRAAINFNIKVQSSNEADILMMVLR